MTRFEHILVPFDGSKSSLVALRTALNVAGRFDTKVTAVYVKRIDDDKKADEVKEVIEKERTASGRSILLMRPVGKMYKEVVKTVEEVGADVIIMGTHGISGFEEFWIGSNAFRVVSSSPVPVITMQETFDKRSFEKIVAPIDQSKDTRQKIPMVARLAKLFKAEVHLIGTTKYSDDESSSIVRRYMRQSLELLDKEDVKPIVTYELGKNVAKTTLTYAKEQKADLIVMMSESEPSSGFFMGSNAQQVVNHSDIPVLTLQPKEVGIAVTGY
ncbi:MAG: universal stress protein [Flavobacteriales bacterium]|nr:universal stress protein [Flavobacteriales bacterium]